MDKINKMDNNQPVKKHIDNINSEDPSMQKEELERMLMWIKHYRDKMSYESYSFIKNTLHKLDFPVPYLIVPEINFYTAVDRTLKDRIILKRLMKFLAGEIFFA